MEFSLPRELVPTLFGSGHFTVLLFEGTPARLSEVIFGKRLCRGSLLSEESRERRCGIDSCAKAALAYHSHIAIYQMDNGVIAHLSNEGILPSLFDHIPLEHSYFLMCR